MTLPRVHEYRASNRKHRYETVTVTDEEMARKGRSFLDAVMRGRDPLQYDWQPA